MVAPLNSFLHDLQYTSDTLVLQVYGYGDWIPNMYWEF